MRFGFAQVPREHYAKHVELIKFGEELGFDFAWLTDQTFYRDPYVLLSLALEACRQRILAQPADQLLAHLPIL